MKKLRVAVVFGGRSGEHEVSLVSARSVISALNTKKYAVTPIKIKKNGEWEHKNAVTRIFQKKFDVIFPVLHGPFGEDGTFQGLCEMADIAYVGAGVTASAVAMDKYLTKLIFKAHGLPQADFLHFTAHEVRTNFMFIAREVTRRLGFPCFVKPSNLGSSVGISKVKKSGNLKKALLLAAKYDSSILVEKGINAREIEFAVLGNEDPEVSIAGEIVPCREFYDYYAKYVDDASRLFIPAKISAKKMKEGQKLAAQAYTALQCSGMARVDFLMDKKTGKFYLNELNTIPGFTAISMYPKLWAASSLSYSRLLDRLIELAIKRLREKSRLSFSFESGSDWHEESEKQKAKNEK